MPIRIFALFKSTIYITALESFLRSNDIEVVSKCSNCELAIDFYKKVDSDLVLMDLNWSGRSDALSGESLIKRFQLVNPDVKVIAVTSFFEPFVRSKLPLLGVQGYIFRSMDNVLEQIKLCIETVHEGGRHYVGINHISKQDTPVTGATTQVAQSYLLHDKS